MDNSKKGNTDEADNNKPPAVSEEKTDILQHEKLIDPGNEHSHDVDDEEKTSGNKEARFDAQSGDDNTEPTTKE